MNRRDFLKCSTSAAATVLLSSVATADELFTKNEDKMKIVVLTGSPRRNGNTNYLADRFIAGQRKRNMRCSVSIVPPIRLMAVWLATVAAWTVIVC